MCNRGAVAQAAGLTAATCGRRGPARELLSDGLAVHREHGSGWMAQRSDDARPAHVRVVIRNTGMSAAIASNASTGALRSTGMWARAPGATAR